MGYACLHRSLINPRWQSFGAQAQNHVQCIAGMLHTVRHITSCPTLRGATKSKNCRRVLGSKTPPQIMPVGPGVRAEINSATQSVSQSTNQHANQPANQAINQPNVDITLHRSPLLSFALHRSLSLSIALHRSSSFSIALHRSPSRA